MRYSMVFLHYRCSGLRGQCDPCVIQWYFSTAAALAFGVNVTPASIRWYFSTAAALAFGVIVTPASIRCYFSTAAALAFGVNVTHVLFDGISPLPLPWPLGSM